VTAEPIAPAVLSAVGLHRFYRTAESEVAALRDVTVELAAGEIVAVVGPSGSGKSTLLGILAGLDDPDGGAVHVAGRRLSHESAARQARLRGEYLGVLTQAGGLIEHLTVRGNVALAAWTRHRTRRSNGTAPLRAEVGKALDAVRLTARAGARPSQLSGGETARAGLAVALVAKPLVLLADEPTAELSADEERELLTLLPELLPPGGAAVLVTHSEAVAAIAHRVLEMRDGRLAS
jgi:putative ABC transport system ATP-binding protein